MKSGVAVQLILTFFYAVIMLKPLVEKFQTEGYSLLTFFKRNKSFFRQFRHYLFISALFFAISICCCKIKNNLYFSAAITVGYFILQSVAILMARAVKVKKKLVYTPRAVRLYILAALVFSAFAIHAVTVLTRAFGDGAAIYAVTGAPIFLPLSAYAALLTSTPFERLNNLRYELAAGKTLTRYPALIKIGITGSFGKTSVKNILTHILESRYRVLATEGNFNTPLGIARAVERLDEYTDVFIAELGARKKGDISRLMKLVKPQIGVLTGVTNQHLKTFKSLENIYVEKEKVITMLPAGGYGVVNAVGTDVSRLSFSPHAVGLSGSGVFVKNAETGCNGVTFVLVIYDKEYAVRTKLLGAHNLQNIVTAAAVALHLKIEPQEIVEAVTSLPQVPHRLQLIKNGGITVIDDTYNSNPVGAAEALAVLADFPQRRVVVTPGLVELGDDEAEENRRLGERLAGVADVVILIGKSRAENIKSGLLSCGFDSDGILEYATLFLAEADFPSLFKSGDTVLFLNDLPSSYDE